jgi:hypothetical protein
MEKAIFFEITVVYRKLIKTIVKIFIRKNLHLCLANFKIEILRFAIGLNFKEKDLQNDSKQNGFPNTK